MADGVFSFTLAHWPVAALALIPALLNVAVLAYLVLRVKKTAVTYTFAAFVASLTVWQISDTMTRLSSTAEGATFWIRALGLGALLITPIGLHFALLFTGREGLARSPLVLALLYLPALGFEVFARAGLNDTTLGASTDWGWLTAAPAPAANRLLGIWTAASAIAILVILGQYALGRSRADARRTQALLVAGGFAVPTLQGTLTQVIFPTFLGFPAVPVASTFMSVFSIATLIALTRYRFLATMSVEERLRLTQEALSQEQLLLAESQRIAHIGSWDWDTATNRVVWSEEMYEIYDVPRSVPVTFDLAMANVFPEDAAEIGRRLERGFAIAEAAFISTGAREHTFPTVEYRIRRKGGKIRTLHGEGRVLLDEKGKRLKLIGTVQDITERAKLESESQAVREKLREFDRLRQMNEFKTRFLNMAAHELNTPLTPVKIQLHLLKTQAAKRLKPRELAGVEILERNVDRLIGLVGDLLDAARLQSGRMSIERKEVDLRRLATEAAESFGPAARNSGVELQVQIAESLAVNADPGRISQVFYNLFGNALKFTKPGGWIIAEGALLGDEAVISVTDSGSGLTTEQMARLFEPFVQVHEGAGGARGGGTGLGLYICKGLLELHGGRIWCESAGPGKGSTFSFAVPVHAARPRGDMAVPNAVQDHSSAYP
jgi:signal transduction histidine kinase